MAIQTGRFGLLELHDDDPIQMTQGILGFPDSKRFCIVDSGDSLVLWFQSLEEPHVAFPILEPKLFKPDYHFRLSQNELKELALDELQQAVILTILTIPESISEMSANLKAPLVLNPVAKLAKQVVLQENEHPIRYPMFHSLRAALANYYQVNHESSDQAPYVIPLRRFFSKQA